MNASKHLGGNIRLLRVNENIRHALSEVFVREELRDPKLFDVSLTVTEVRTSPDLKHAEVYVLPLGGKDQEAILESLNHAAPFIGSCLARRVNMKFTPKLRFLIDKTFDESTRINKLLSDPKVAQDLRKKD